MIQKIKNRAHRRNYFIKKDFQGKMILGLFLFVICSIILFTVIFGLFSANSMTISYSNHNLQFGQTPVMLFKYALAANWVFIILGGILIMFLILRISHHVAGPQFHFEKVLKHMIDGNLNSTISLRKHDEGTTLATSINSFNSGLSQKLRTIDRHTLSINELIDLIDREERKKSVADRNTQIEKYDSIREHTDAIRKVTTSFTLTDE